MRKVYVQIACLLAILWLGYACYPTQQNEKKYPYPKNLAISSSSGRLKSYKLYHLPTEVIHDTHTVKMVFNQWLWKSYSANMYASDEPVLYNYYLGKTIYRFMYVNVFYPATIISLIKEQDEYFLDIKQLDRSATDALYPRRISYRFKTQFVPPNPENDNTETSTMSIDKILDTVFVEPWTNEVIPQDSIVLPEKSRKRIKIHTKQRITRKEWEKFEELLEKADFWNLQNDEERSMVDGSYWLLEAHRYDRYWFVGKLSPSREDNYTKCCNYLLQLAKKSVHEIYLEF